MLGPGAAGSLGPGLRLLSDLLRQGQREFVEQLQRTGRVAGLESRLFHRCRLNAFTDRGNGLGDEGTDDS